MPGSRLALVVATDEYLDGSLRGLSSPASDAEALASVLGDPALGQFEVEVMHNAESRDIALRLEELLTENRPQDVVLIHFSCHGLKDDSGHLYLAARDTLPNRLWSTAVDATLVNRLIRRSRAGQVLLLLDCCYGGAFERGMVARAAGDVDVGGQFEQLEALSSGRGRAVITASSAMEYAFEGARLQETNVAPQPSVFTSALTEGLRTGEADRDQDGLVSLGELYDHVFDRVREVNPKQTPGKWEYGTQGELVVARNPNRRVTPATLPASLQELVNHPFAATRHGAVLELRKLASATNLALAAAARSELVRLQSDDSRQVCTAAVEAVEATRVGVTQKYVDFGQVDRGEPRTSVVELTGVPLVELSRARAEGGGITVRQVGRSLTIELDTGAPARIDARVLVDGPAGAAVVTVQGTVKADRVQVDPVMPGPVPPEPAPPGPVPPEPVPVDPVEPDRRRARTAAVVVLLGTAGSLLTLGADWSTGSQVPPGPPGEHLVTGGAAAYLLPLALLVAGAALLWFRGGTPVALGLVVGAAGAGLVVMGQHAARLTFDERDWAPSAAFWLAMLFRVVALAGGLLAAWGVLRGGASTRAAGGALRLLAGVVVLTATVGGYVLAELLEVAEISMDQLAVSLAVALVLGLATSFLLLPPAPRRALLVAVTVLCVLVALSDLQLWRSWQVQQGTSARWQLIDATVFAVVALVAWVVQGSGSTRPTPGRRGVRT